MAKRKSRVISTLYYKHWPETSVEFKLAFCPHFLYSSLDSRLGLWLSLGNIKRKNSDLDVPPYTPAFAKMQCVCRVFCRKNYMAE